MNLPTLRLKLSEEFIFFASRLKGENVTLGKLLQMVEVRGHSLLLILLSFPFMLPIPIPGLSIIFGLVIVLAGVRIALSLPPWIPQFILSREISTDRAKKLFAGASKILARAEKLLKPRFTTIFRSKWIRPIDGFLLIIMGAVLALPLPPGTNFPPALSILCMGLGMLEKDGLFIIFSYIFFALNVAVFSLIAFLGYEGAIKLLQ